MKRIALTLALLFIAAPLWAQTVVHTYHNQSQSITNLAIPITNDTTGDVLLLGAAGDNNLTSVSGNCSTWTLVKQGGSTFYSDIYIGSNCSGTTSVTTHTSGSGYESATVKDVAGIISLTADVTSSATGTTGTAISAGSAAITNPTDIGICVLNAVNGSTLAFIGTPADNSGVWVNDNLYNVANIGTQQVSQITVATGTHTCVQTANNPSTNWSGAQAFFKAANTSVSVVGEAVGTPGVTSCAIAYTPKGVGNLLVVNPYGQATGVNETGATLLDTNGNAWGRDVNRAHSDRDVGLWSTLSNNSTNPDTITFTYSGSAPTTQCAIHEFSCGVGCTWARDANGGGIASSSFPQTTLGSSGGMTNAAFPTLEVGAIDNFSGVSITSGPYDFDHPPPAGGLPYAELTDPNFPTTLSAWAPIYGSIASSMGTTALGYGVLPNTTNYNGVQFQYDFAVAGPTPTPTVTLTPTLTPTITPTSTPTPVPVAINAGGDPEEENQ